MFAWKEKRNLRNQINRLNAGESDTTGANRRAIGLVPMPDSGENREIMPCATIKYHQLLISIEAKQSTCCLRVNSPRVKSRSAILIFRGRVLGCIYGNQKLGHQISEQAALQCAMTDMSAEDTVLDAYLLSEELVLAAAALFHSNVMPSMGGEDPVSLLERGIHGLLRAKSPGCVVVNNRDNMAVCMVYLFGGKIVGVYSYQDGWLEPTYQCAEQIVRGTKGAQIMASCLAASDIGEVLDLAFSLTGLNGRRFVPAIRPMDMSVFDSGSHFKAVNFLKPSFSRTLQQSAAG